MGKLLIIDDDTEYAAMIAHQMAALDHDVEHRATLVDGISCVSAFQPEVVFLDVVLPDGNGLQWIRDIKAASSFPEIIVITGAGDRDGAEAAVRSGAWDYWQKGRSIKELGLPVQYAIEYRRDRLAERDRRPLDHCGLVGESQAMAACFGLIREAASSDASALLHGETGTGKELVARAIHRNSARAEKAFVVVDCGALTETLMESSLFGHGKGAFTGASHDRTGLVRQANEGTLFLDEVGELPLASQKAFLRVLQEKRFRPLGSDREQTSDFRLVAATNRDLAKMVQAGSFREDLYFRLRSMEILLPPLRDRGSDAIKIAENILLRNASRPGQVAKTMSRPFAEALESYRWPGNVRELCQAIECAEASAGTQPVLKPIHLPIQMRVELARSAVTPQLNQHRPRAPYTTYPTLSAVRDRAVSAYLARVLQDTEGDVEAACELAELSRSRLYQLLRLHGVSRTRGIAG